jgi:hypothetical protein
VSSKPEVKGKGKSSAYCTPSSTKKTDTVKTTSNYLSISPPAYPQLAIPLDRLIEGFLLSCKVENKSPEGSNQKLD